MIMAKDSKEPVTSRDVADSPLAAPAQAPAGAVPIANATAGVPGAPNVQPQAPQPSNEGTGEHVEQSAKRAALKETADAARKRATEAKDKADKALAEAQRLAGAAADLDREARAAEAAANPEQARYVVAEGKSLYALKGQLGAFQDVSARDFQGGAEELERHIKSGFVVLRR
jgi:hypothetical protein